jgi:hypothetical protein
MIAKTRGRRGWIFHLVLRLPIWFRRYSRQQAPMESKTKEA